VSSPRKRTGAKLGRRQTLRKIIIVSAAAMHTPRPRMGWTGRAPPLTPPQLLYLASQALTARCACEGRVQPDGCATDDPSPSPDYHSLPRQQLPISEGQERKFSTHPLCFDLGTTDALVRAGCGLPESCPQNGRPTEIAVHPPAVLMPSAGTILI
jgi:hypothetical protein